jgi:hypothetical protein
LSADQYTFFGTKPPATLRLISKRKTIRPGVVEGVEMRVIARAYADRPLDRVVVERSPKLTYIASEAAASSMEADGTGVGFPTNCVFKFDESLYRSLEEAWQAQNRERLLDLWSEAQPI